MLNFFCWKNHFLGYVEFFPLKEALFFQESASFCWSVEYVESCWILCSKNVLLSAEMLNMLNMLNYFASSWSPLASHRPKKIQHIQHIQHFSRKKHIFQTLDPTWSNIFNISAERSTFSAHVEFFLLKEPLFGPCWIFSAERTTFWVMLSFFPWKKPFFSKSASFCWNVEYVRSCWMPFPKKVLLSAEMLNMLNMLNYFASSQPILASNRAKIIQHIQHIQHFSRKKHIF